ncbi:MAG: hypothetical protein K6G28_00310 [Acholeplasmatales bacterium]|nr:hypothetical protein [Acholeplasmatales bacterium]
MQLIVWIVKALWFVISLAGKGLLMVGSAIGAIIKTIFWGLVAFFTFGRRYDD